MAAAAEFWVMRERKRVARAEELDEVERAAVATGELALVQLGRGLVLCEPVECCGDQEAATRRALACAQRTGHTYTVVLNADLDSLARA